MTARVIGLQGHDRDQTDNQRNAATVDSCFELGLALVSKV